MQTFFLYFITTLWTPIFVAIFLGIVAYSIWPSNGTMFDDAAKMPLRED
jgi:cytochrome c oxidase cbb3-type subunit 4